MHRVWFRRSRLAERAAILLAIDKAVLKEGGLEHMSSEGLRNACLMRGKTDIDIYCNICLYILAGLNPSNMKNEDMITWLQTWLTISKEVDKYSFSLLLHCPILLAYNHPSNWHLIYKFDK